MADNVYQFIGTKNARLVKFLDRHEGVSGALMKIVMHLEQISSEWGRDLNKESFEVTASPDGRMVLIKLRAGKLS